MKLTNLQMPTEIVNSGLGSKSESRALSVVPAVAYKHLRATANFRLKPQPLSGSVVPWLFKPTVRPMDTGALVDYLMSEIRKITGMVNTNHFTLVNVQSPLSMSSTGFYAGPPPESALPSAHGSLCFTFALAPDVNWNSIVVARRVFKSIYVTTFNTDQSARPQFLAIVIDTNRAYDWGLTSLTWYRLQYLYYSVGMMTKNRVRLSRELKRQPDDFYPNPADPWLTFNSVEYRAITYLPNFISYQNWSYCAAVLTVAPNLLSTRHINTAFLQFVITRNLLTTLDLPYYLQVHLDVAMEQAVDIFVRLVNRPQFLNDANDLTPIECLVPLMIYVSRAGSQDSRSMTDQTVSKYASSVLASLSVRFDAVNQIMAPSREAAMDLAAGRMSRVQQLSDLLGEIQSKETPT